MTCHFCYLDSPIGRLLLAGTGDFLELIGLPGGSGAVTPEACWAHDEASHAEAQRQLTEYFDGRREQFSLALRPDGTAFQLSVLAALQEIPYGETRSYRDIATAVGRPKAVRAVGAANGRNPLPIVIPCHRVIGADGSLTGFGGGLDAKAWLLQHESRAFRLREPAS